MLSHEPPIQGMPSEIQLLLTKASYEYFRSDEETCITKAREIGISALPTACPLRGYGRAGTQNDRLGHAVGDAEIEPIQSRADSDPTKRFTIAFDLADSDLNSVALTLRAARLLFQTLRLVRSTPAASGMRTVLLALIMSLPSLLNIGGLLLSLIMVPRIAPRLLVAPFGRWRTARGVTGVLRPRNVPFLERGGIPRHR